VGQGGAAAKTFRKESVQLHKHSGHQYRSTVAWAVLESKVLVWRYLSIGKAYSIVLDFRLLVKAATGIAGAVGAGDTALLKPRQQLGLSARDS
jgi:hypothetical protein